MSGANERSYFCHCGYPVAGDRAAVAAEEEEAASAVTAMGAPAVAIVAAGDALVGR